MPKVSQAHLDARRRQFVEAAQRCFARQGFHPTTVPDICREAGLSTGAFYCYFKSKEEIVQTMCKEGLRQDAEIIAASAEAEHAAVAFEKLEGFFTRIAGPRESVHLGLTLQYWAEAVRNPAIAQAIRDAQHEYLSALAGIVQAGQARGEVNPALDPQAVARVLVALFYGLIPQASLENEFDTGAYVDVTRALLGGTFLTGGHIAGGGNSSIPVPPARPMAGDQEQK